MKLFRCGLRGSALPGTSLQGARCFPGRRQDNGDSCNMREISRTSEWSQGLQALCVLTLAAVRSTVQALPMVLI